eukprot:8038610-Lingulodinium_polyedra.AAC.1
MQCTIARLGTDQCSYNSRDWDGHCVHACVWLGWMGWMVRWDGWDGCRFSHFGMRRTVPWP